MKKDFVHLGNRFNRFTAQTVQPGPWCVTLHNAPELLALPKGRRVGARITQLAAETAQLKKPSFNA